MKAMTCNELTERFDEFIEERLRPAESRDVEFHLKSCIACRETLELLAGSEEGSHPAPPAGLLSTVLNRTSGKACGRARVLLCDHVDGGLGQVDDELMRLHLHGCADCAALETVLSRMAVDLPALAELRPDERFVLEVLARTVPRRRRVARRLADLATGWRALVQRPRFAWEGAYLGMVFLVLLFAVPTSPLAGVPQRALVLMRSNPVAILGRQSAELAPRYRVTVRTTWNDTAAQAAAATRDFAEGVAEGSSGTLEAIRIGFGTIWERLTSQDTTSDHDRSADEADGN